MCTTNPHRIFDQIETTVCELRPELFLGPTTRDPDGLGIAVPLIAASDPVNPTLLAFENEGTIWMIVERIAPMHNLNGLMDMLIRFKRGRVKKEQISSLLLALAAALASNRRDGTSWIGLDSDDGNVFLKDSISVTDFKPKMFGEWFRSVVEHARQLRNFVMQLGLDLPDDPEPPFANCFPTA